MKRYKFNDPQDMIDLAQKVQSEVYWDKSYYDEETDDSLYFKYFWDSCQEKLNAGYAGVVIEDVKYGDAKVRFFK